MTTDSSTGRGAAIYNDPLFNYAQFWTGREYEHESEVSALRRLLGQRHYGHAADIGGGYGRLAIILTQYADRVTLADPSSQQLSLSREIFPGEPFARELADASKLPFADGSVDLAVVVRILHHLPDPEPGAGRDLPHPAAGRARHRRGGQLRARGPPPVRLPARPAHPGVPGGHPLGRSHGAGATPRT